MEKPQKQGQVPHPSSSKTPKLAAFQRSPTIVSFEICLQVFGLKVDLFSP